MKSVMLALLLLIPTTVFSQELESVGVVALEATDQLSIKTAITDLGDYKQVDGMVLIEKGTKPKVAEVGYLVLAGDFVSAVVEADDIKRELVPSKMISSKEWLISGQGRVIVSVTKIYENPVRLEKSRFSIDFNKQPLPPKPDPQPEPDPSPEEESPFDGDGLRILIVYELDEVAKYPTSVQQVLYSKTLRQYAIQNAERDGKGNPELRIFDQHTVNQEEQWSKLLSQSRSSLPWIYVGNGTSGYSGPLPKTEEETLDLIKKFK